MKRRPRSGPDRAPFVPDHTLDKQIRAGSGRVFLHRPMFPDRSPNKIFTRSSTTLGEAFNLPEPGVSKSIGANSVIGTIYHNLSIYSAIFWNFFIRSRILENDLYVTRSGIL